MVDENNMLVIYTDGACSGNPGPGGWGVVMHWGDKEKQLSGYQPQTTNNRMELLAAIEALKAVTKPVPIQLYTDSQYVKNGMEIWMKNWKQKNWKTANKKPVKNQDLWQTLDELCQNHQVEWHWVKGHDNNPGNEMADKLARNAITHNQI